MDQAIKKLNFDDKTDALTADDALLILEAQGIITTDKIKNTIGFLVSDNTGNKNN